MEPNRPLGIAALKDTGQHSKTLNILIIGSATKDLVSFFIANDLLRNYLADIKSLVKIQLFTSDTDLKKLHDPDAIIVNSDLGDYRNVRDFGINKNIDLILDLHEQLVCDETKAYNVEFGYVNTVEELNIQCEAFLAGNGVPWCMSNPIWNDSWVRIFFSHPGLSKTVMDFKNQLNGKYTSDQSERVRHIANRMSQIEYGRLMLKYWLQMKRKERRITQRKHIPSFEIHYHLGNYYFLIGGAFDMLARLLNSVFDMKIELYKHLAVEKTVFQNELVKHDKDLAAIYSDQDSVDWLLWLKTRRNYISHDASISITTLVKEPTTPITDEEVSKLVDEKLNWSLLASGLPPDLYEGQRRMVAELVKMDLYDVELEDIMLLRDKGDKIFLPLNSIDYDFDKMAGIIEPTITILTNLQA